MLFDGIRALSFDCYGTLIDWETGLLNALRPYLERAGAAVPDDRILADYARLETSLENEHPTMLYRDLLKRVFLELMSEWEIAAEEDDADRFAQSIHTWPPFPDTPTALEYLGREFELAILSNVDRESFAHTNQLLGGRFDLVVTAEDVGAYKPSLENFRALVNAYAARGIDEHEILHAAQSLFHDIEPAMRLGLRNVWVDRRSGKAGWGATRPPEETASPKYVVRSLGELVNWHRREMEEGL